LISLSLSFTLPFLENEMTVPVTDKPPTREERKKCWKLRDEYFACLDQLTILDPAIVEKQPERAASCLDKKKHYEDACMASWVCTVDIKDVAWKSS
jgi:cytochrome c oxidase assembly factor 6